jgi:molybdate transport system ATP-binding protein
MADEAIVAEFEKRYPGGPAIHVALRMPADRAHVLVLFGPSGVGKTTVVRCFAGLEAPTSGRICVGHETWVDTDANVLLSPQARRAGYLFQDYALFPHLTIAQNIGYALKRDQRPARVAELVRLLRLEGLEDRYPSQVSGGQQQRVALARVLAFRPRLLLLDEPLSALDAPTREQLRMELRTVLHAQGIPAIWITHDWVEALALADVVAVMGAGRVLQVGSPEEVFSRPADAEVAAIVGVESVLAGVAAERREELVAVEVGGVRIWALDSPAHADAFYVCIRAEDVTLEPGERPGVSSARNHLVGRVAEIRPFGPVSRVSIDCGITLSAVITRQASQDLGLKPGATVTAIVKASAVHLIPR